MLGTCPPAHPHIPSPWCHLQLEALIVLGGPAVVLGFGGEFPLLVTEVGPNDVDLDEGPEDSRGLPLEVIGSHHCKEATGEAQGALSPAIPWHPGQQNPPLTVTLCSPLLGWVKSSTWMDTSPTGSSTPAPVTEGGNGSACFPSAADMLCPTLTPLRMQVTRRRGKRGGHEGVSQRVVGTAVWVQQE